MKESIISVKGLSVSYERKRVLANIFLEIEAGRVVGVVGPNGAGKSTLFKAILGLIDINTGTIKVAGKPIEEVKKKMAYVPQKNDVDWNFPATVMDIVQMGRYPHVKVLSRLSKRDIEISEYALEEVGMIQFRDRQIGELSGGQQQRVFLGRALCQEADVFFLDEPFVGVDITTEEKIINILRKMASESKTLLVVHHDLSTVDDYFHDVILLNQRLIAYGPTESTFSSENIKLAYGGQLPVLHDTGKLDD